MENSNINFANIVTDRMECPMAIESNYLAENDKSPQ